MAGTLNLTSSKTAPNLLGMHGAAASFLPSSLYFTGRIAWHQGVGAHSLVQKTSKVQNLWAIPYLTCTVNHAGISLSLSLYIYIYIVLKLYFAPFFFVMYSTRDDAACHLTWRVDLQIRTARCLVRPTGIRIMISCC
jgi:hypothetical protein